MPAPRADTRPDPDALLDRFSRAGRGRLKIFLGAAPGVGKTWEMLTAARRKREEGADVLAGLIETHGRAETIAQIEDLPVLPRLRVPYRGQVLEEFDLEAALAAKPALLLVDELAHTNAPGLRHAKRWQDVETLRDAGIDVWATLNVQHLESLNDQVARITGIRVAETVPDTVLAMADEVEIIDLPSAELRQRLNEGRIYRADVAARALNGFFREGNLAALREMALRRAAQHVDKDISAYMRARAIAGPWPASERVLALIDPKDSPEQTVRAAARLAEALRAPFIVFHAERAEEGPPVQPALDLAVQLGGTVETTTNADIAGALFAFTAQQNVSHLVLSRGRSRRARALAGRIARRAGAYTLHIAPEPAAVAARGAAARLLAARSVRLFHGAPWAYGACAAVLCLLTLAGWKLQFLIPQEAMGLIFAAAVTIAASRFGRGPALFTALGGFLLWNFFFLDPVLTLSVDDPRNIVALVVFLVVGVITGTLASRVRVEAEAARSRVEALRRIALFGRRLGDATDAEALALRIAEAASELARQAAVLMPAGGELRLQAIVPPAEIDDAAFAAADFAYRNAVPTGAGTFTLPSVPWRFVPLGADGRGQGKPLGVLGVRPEGAVPEPLAQALAALADHGAAALERLGLTEAAAEGRARAGTQRLRAALLNSLSHDLRTPLTSLKGAAETLAASGAALPPAARADLLAAIVQDADRMTRFLANITGMARIETGEIVARDEEIALGPVAEAAVLRVQGAFSTVTRIGAGAEAARGDPALLEQVLVNLLENAVKYAPDGSGIVVSTQRRGDGVEIAVADEGVGIRAEDLPHVFDSFFRASRGDRVVPGTGLGLAIAKALTEAMGGGIAAESPRPDLPADGLPGTVVRVRLRGAGAR